LPELLTPAQVAEKLAICRATVYKLTTAGNWITSASARRSALAALAAYLAHRPKSEPCRPPGAAPTWKPHVARPRDFRPALKGLGAELAGVRASLRATLLAARKHGSAVRAELDAEQSGIISSPMPDDLQRLVPDCRVSVGGNPLTLEKDAALTRVIVDLDVDLFGQCVLEFNDPRLALINGEDFAAGTPVKVELGFGAQKGKVFEGEVVALEPLFRRDLSPSLRVVCQESLHRLALASMTRSFQDVDDKQIVSQIAQEHGLSGDAPAGTATHVLQSNLSDAAFLRRIAQKHGNHLRISGKQLIIGPPPRGGQISVGPDSGVSRMKVRIKSSSQVSEISVHGWDPLQKREIVGKARAQGETGEGSRSHGGGAVLSFAGHEHAPVDAVTAEAMAKGRMRKIAEGFVTAQVEMLGHPQVAPGAELKFEKLGPPADGTWRVEQAEHSFSKHGYFVKFRAVRIARPRPPRPVAPPPKPPPPQPQPRQQQPAPAAPQPLEGTRIEVKVVDPLGNPKANFFFKLTKQGSPDQPGMTDAEGFIRTTVPAPGQWKLTFPDVDGAAQPQPEGH
jgi:phage protein D